MSNLIDFLSIPRDLPKISEIFDKHNVVARAYHDVQGSGPSECKEVQEMVHTRMTGRKFTPKFEKRTHLNAFQTA